MSIYRNIGMGDLEIYKKIRKNRLQAACYGCGYQEAYIDTDGVLGCRKYSLCCKVDHFALAIASYADPDFDDIEYAHCSNCGQVIAEFDRTDTCPLCGYKLIWDEKEYEKL